MDIFKIIRPECIEVDAELKNKADTLNTIARIAKKCHRFDNVSEEQIARALEEREKIGSTGFGKGIAIPHCRVENCNQPVGCLITLAEPIDFDAPDNQPVDLVFALLVPDGEHQQHLDTLAGIARLFSQAGFCARLRAARDAEALFSAATSEPG